MNQHRLEHFPISFFASVMGTAGLAIAWRKAHQLFGTPEIIAWVITGLAFLMFFLLGITYITKWIRYPQAVMAEFRHPIKINFFPTISISLLLLAATLLESVPDIAYGLWLSGTLLQFFMTLAIVNSWLHHQHYKIQQLIPAWFIPAVGNIIVPIAGVHLAGKEISLFFFSIGLFFWLMLCAAILFRLFFYEPLPDKLKPTLFILIAPPAICCISWAGIAGEMDVYALIFYNIGLFITLLLVVKGLDFIRLPFFLSSWAYSFPLAAITIASLLCAQGGGVIYAWIGGVLLLALTVIITLLLFATLLAIRKQQICVPD